MTRKLNWLLALLVVTMLLAACGPDMATPTPGSRPEEEADTQPTASPEEGEEETASPPGELPVDDDDWRVLGSTDAPVTIIEYSDFQ
jgi:protein-disulfide isomerase